MAKESGRKENWPFIPIPVPMPVPMSPGDFEEILTRVWPNEYRDSLTHLQNARIEVLKAIDAAIRKRIEILETRQTEAAPRKEKVNVE